MTRHPRVWRMAFLDMAFILALVFAVVVVILVVWINDPSQDAEADNEALIDPQGTLIFEMAWPPECEADVDLWVRAPDGSLVGFSRKDSDAMNLLRDDLGHVHDPGWYNAETVLTREIQPGEWLANAHLYNAKGCATPITVKFSLKRREQTDTVPPRAFGGRERGAKIATLIEKEVQLHRHWEEATLARFTLDDAGALIASSISQECEPIAAVGNPMTAERRVRC